MIHKELWNALRKRDPKDVSRKSLALYDENTKSYRLKVLNREYSIIPNERKIYATDPPAEQSPFYLQLAAVNYLLGAKDIPLDGCWVSEKEFPSGMLFFRGPHALPVKKLEDTFGQDTDRFASACRSLGGIKVEGGDASFELLVFPRIPVRLILWRADDEFPARFTYLFDRTASLHLQLDAIWALGNLIETLLLESVKKHSNL